MVDFVPGQRWINYAESQLGLGTVLRSDHRTVTLVFLATGDTRTYSKQSAQLTRVKFSIGDTVKNLDGLNLTVKDRLENDGLLTYVSVDEQGKPIRLEESQLDNFLHLSGPLQRLFNGQVDAKKWFELRYRTRIIQSRLSQSELRGLNGCRTSLVPHQLYIAHEVGQRYAPRVLLADEVGLGKTIEAGLIIHFQLITERAKRVLITVPQSLVNQWFVEMLRRFNLHFNIYDESRCEAIEQSSGLQNPFHSDQLILCSIDFLTDNPDRKQQIEDADWDLVVVDEAHHLEWSPRDCNLEYQIIEQIAAKTAGLILITATPEQLGKDSHFARLRLLDPDRFSNLDAFIEEENAYKPIADTIGALLSDQPLDSIGRKILAECINEEDNRPLLDMLASTDHQQAEFDTARQALIDHLLDRHGTGRVLFRNTRTTIQGFPERKVHGCALPYPETYNIFDPDDEIDPALFATPETMYRSLASKNSTDWTDFDPRIVWLKEKLDQLKPNKVLLITANADTAIDIADSLKINWKTRAAVFHERLSIVERDRSAAYFANHETGCQILICSEIGSEGRNFQFAHHLVLFDLPLNPDLLQQRIGRLDRIGQTDLVQIHVPFLDPSAQSILFRWYHLGLNAFENHCSAGLAVYAEVKTDLLTTIVQNTENIDELIDQTKQCLKQMNQVLQQGRDRLLEYHSCRPDVANALKLKAQKRDLDPYLQQFMDTVFDYYGVESEALDHSSFAVRPGNHMSAPFPRLPNDGVSITFDRKTALSKEDLDYLTWEHPMVVEAMDLVVTQETGNTALSAVKLSGLKPGLLLVECVYSVEIASVQALQTDRYVPPTIIRLLIDENYTDRSSIDHQQLNEASIEVDQQTAYKILSSKQQNIKSLIAHSESIANTRSEAELKHSQQIANQSLLEEINRLHALHRINPNVRMDEIEFFQDQLDKLNRIIVSGNARLDAIRVLIAL